MTAISRGKVNIYIVAANTAPSTLADTDMITGQIKSYRKSGGDIEVESDPMFGGFVDKEKPQSQFQLEFDIVPSLEQAELFQEMIYGSDTATGVITSAASKPLDRCVYIEGTAGTSIGVVGYGFNNCNVTLLDMEHSADDNQTQTMTLKFSPTNESGVANYVFNSLSRDTDFTSITKLPNWTALDNN